MSAECAVCEAGVLDILNLNESVSEIEKVEYLFKKRGEYLVPLLAILTVGAFALDGVPETEHRRDELYVPLLYHQQMAEFLAFFIISNEHVRLADTAALDCLEHESGVLYRTLDELRKFVALCVNFDAHGR